MDSQLLAQQMALDGLEKHLKQGQKDPLYISRKAEIAVSEKGMEGIEKEAAASGSKRKSTSCSATIRARRRGLANDVALLDKRKEELNRLKGEHRGCKFAEEDLRKEITGLALKDREQLSGESLNLKFRKDELAEAQSVLAKFPTD